MLCNTRVKVKISFPRTRDLVYSDYQTENEFIFRMVNLETKLSFGFFYAWIIF